MTLPHLHEDMVRAYDAFVESIDLGEPGIVLNPNKVGNAEYDPRVMLKLLVFGYSMESEVPVKLPSRMC